MKKRSFKTIIFLLLSLCILVLPWYFIKLRADNTLCQEILVKPKGNADFYTLLQNLSENEGEGNALRSWRDMQNRYDIFSDGVVQKIDAAPGQYLSDALKVIANPAYDQSQKMYTVMMMQKLPIKEYLCVMDVVNTALENHVITDKDVAMQAINPDLNIKGTSLYYWWLPDWRARFKKNADVMFTQEHVDDVLEGHYMWSYPY
ncbi:hypothetical protein [Serratia sp. D1N4]